MKPPVSEPESESCIKPAIQTLNPRFQEEMRIRQKMNYLQCEEGTIEEAIGLARMNPGLEREAWEWMSNALEMLNTLLTRRGLPPMYYPRYQRFLRLLRTTG